MLVFLDSKIFPLEILQALFAEIHQSFSAPFQSNINEFLEGCFPIMDGDEQSEEIVSGLVNVAFILIADAREGWQVGFREDSAGH